VPKPEKHTLPSETNGAHPTTSEPRRAPEVMAHSKSVNVAFPFSQIKLEQPSQELADLAGLVLDLVVTMSEWVPEDQLEELRMRARALRDRLR
jgi:hypothetical protein